MLVGNGVRLTSNPMRQMAAPLANVVHRASWMQAGARRNWWTHTGSDRRSGVPDGLRHPASWLMAPRAGGMAARNEVFITSTLGSLLLAEGRNLDGSTTLTFSVPNAALQLIVSATGTTAITFSGSSTLAGALSATGTTAVTFSVGTPTLGAIIDALGAIAITWSGTGTMSGVGSMSGSTVTESTLTADAIAASVWASVLESGLDAQDVMRILLAVAAGQTTIDGTTVVFKSADGAIDRVTAEMDGSERTTVTLNAA